jgi:signal transduction histidine kinase
MIAPKGCETCEDDRDAGQSAWRMQATQAVLMVVAIIGLPLLALGASGVLVALPWRVQLTGAAVLASVLAALMVPRARYRLRAAALLSALYVLTAAQLAVSGLMGQGRIGLALLPVLAMALLGLRAGWVAFSVSALMMASAALLAGNGFLDRWQAVYARDTPLGFWIFQGMNLLAPLVVVMILLTDFVRLQAGTMAAERRTRRKLEEEIVTRRQCEAAITRVGEEERRRLGSELHDGLCQQLTAALLNCTMLERRLASRDAPETAVAGRLRAMLEDAIGASYDVSKGLCPVDLRPEGLVSALERLARQTRDTAGVACDVTSEGPAAVQDPQAALHLFRIAQEAVANALRHARCRAIRIDLHVGDDAVVLRVQDDGAGQGPAAHTPVGGMGIRLMAYRAETLGGTLAIGQPAAGGTLVTCRIPAESAQEAPS